MPWAPGVTTPLPDDIAIYPWTVNLPEQAVELVEFGASGIITDDVATIAAAVEDSQ